MGRVNGGIPRCLVVIKRGQSSPQTIFTISIDLPTTTMSSQVRVAVTQTEPVWLNLNATIEKTCKLITEAAENGAQIITFPECWAPGYPAWIW
jgi:hypothetical protein